MPAKFPLMVKIWAGEASHDLRYIKRSLPSLVHSDLPAECQLILVNDCSTNQGVVPFLERIAAVRPGTEIWTNPQRLGPNRGQEYNFPRLLERFPDAPFCILCDDDVIYHPGWLQHLIRVYEDAKNIGLRGIFTALNTPAKPAYGSMQLTSSAVLLKERQMALNWLVPREVYDAVGPFRETKLAYDHDYGLRMAALGIPVVCLKPSYVQNIGFYGAYQNDNSLTADDFVGTLPWDLWCSHTWHTTLRCVFHAAQWVHGKIPEGRVKRAVRRLRHRGKNLPDQKTTTET